jgi:hypothetical protein
MNTYRVTYYGRRNIRLLVQDVQANNTTAALVQVPEPPGTVRVWIGIVPTDRPSRPQYRPSDGPSTRNPLSGEDTP